MNQMPPLPAGNDNTYDTSDLVVFDCEPIAGPFEAIAPPPEIAIETLRVIGQVASRHLPENQKTLVHMMLAGKTKDDIAKELHVTFPELYFLWRDAYRGMKSGLECLPEIDADLRHWTLVKITHFAKSA